MDFTSAADPEQAEFLSVVLDDYCTTQHISPGTSEHKEVARRIIDLFSTGVPMADLLDALSAKKPTSMAGN